MGKISSFFAPKASTHKDFVKFAVDAHKQRLASTVLQEAEVPNKGIQLTTCGGQVILGKVNRRFAVPRSIHIKGCKKLERFLKSEKAKELYGEKLTNQGLEGLRNIRKGDKRFDPALLDCFEGFVDPDAYKQMWRQRDETTTLYSNNIDAVNALANEDLVSSKRCGFAELAKRDVDTAHQQAVASARLFKLTCLPRANAESVSPTQTELANWLNKAFAAHPDLKEFRASSFVDALFGAYPNKIMELNRELDDLYAQLQAGNHDSDLLTQISNVGQQQAACIERYVRKLALVGQLLSDKFPWEEAPFGSIGIAVAAGRDLNRLAQAYLANGSPMMEMHRFAAKAQAQTFAIQHDGQPAPNPTWADAVKQTTHSAQRQIDRLVMETTPKAGASELTKEQQTFSDWLKDGMTKHPVIGEDLSQVLNFRLGSLQGLGSAEVIASIDRYAGAIEALRLLAVVGAANPELSAAQRKLLTSVSQVLGRLYRRITEPEAPLMVMRQRALLAETDAERAFEVLKLRRQRVEEAMTDARQAYRDFSNACFKPEPGAGAVSKAQHDLRQWVSDQLRKTDATAKLSLASVGSNLSEEFDTIEVLGKRLSWSVKTWDADQDPNGSKLIAIGREAKSLEQRIEAYLAQIAALGDILTSNPAIEGVPASVLKSRIDAGKSMLKLLDVLKNPDGELMQFKATANQAAADARRRAQQMAEEVDEVLGSLTRNVDQAKEDLPKTPLRAPARGVPQDPAPQVTPSDPASYDDMLAELDLLL